MLVAGVLEMEIEESERAMTVEDRDGERVDIGGGIEGRSARRAMVKAERPGGKEELCDVRSCGSR